ncbi:MAG: FecR family protein, partial [Desulfovibrionaceae bacterium]
MPEASMNANSVGSVVGITGKAFAESESGELRPLSEGSPVYQGESIVTGDGANIEIKFADNTLLSQGEDSRIELTEYVYDPDTGAGDLLFDMAEGAFRMATGEIAEDNPENFQVKSPLATIGIRGTVTVHEIRGGEEKHGIEEIHSGKAMVVQNQFGEIRQIFSPQTIVDMDASGAMSQVRSFTVQESQTFQQLSPISVREREEQQEEEQQEEEQEDREEEEAEEEAEQEG